MRIAAGDADLPETVSMVTRRPNEKRGKDGRMPVVELVRVMGMSERIAAIDSDESADDLGKIATPESCFLGRAAVAKDDSTWGGMRFL